MVSLRQLMEAEYPPTGFFQRFCGIRCPRWDFYAKILLLSALETTFAAERFRTRNYSPMEGTKLEGSKIETSQ